MATVRILQHKNKQGFVVMYEPYKWKDSTIIRRGWHKMKVIYERDCCEKELEMLEKSWRLLSFKYDTLEKLITDEVIFLGKGHEEIKVLNNMRKS